MVPASPWDAYALCQQHALPFIKGLVLVSDALLSLVMLPLQPCFLVDSMLGRLCRWLRALGVDAQFVDPGGTLQQRQQLSAADRQQQQNSLVQQIQDAAVQEVSVWAHCLLGVMWVMP